MEWASLIIFAAGMVASFGAWFWACRANQKATKSLEALKQFNRVWYYHSIDPANTKIVEDPRSGMFALALEVKPGGDEANFWEDGSKTSLK